MGSTLRVEQVTGCEEDDLPWESGIFSLGHWEGSVWARTLGIGFALCIFFLSFLWIWEADIISQDYCNLFTFLVRTVSHIFSIFIFNFGKVWKFHENPKVFYVRLCLSLKLRVEKIGQLNLCLNMRIFSPGL